LHLRELGLIDVDVLTVTGEKLGDLLDWWRTSERRQRMKAILSDKDGVDPDTVIMSPSEAKRRGLTSTVTFPRGNLAPEGSVVKSTAIDPSVVDADGIFRLEGPARVFVRESDAIAAIKQGEIKAGDVMVLCGCGPMGTGMEETYQITSALKYLPFGKHVALITDARFSGVSTGACIGHVGPEALAGGPIGKVCEGDIVRVVIDRNRLEGSIDFVGESGREFSREEGARILASRKRREALAPHPQLPDDS
jgi:dihydroxyacid dehydratase/phosphogluconate dehydratase